MQDKTKYLLVPYGYVPQAKRNGMSAMYMCMYKGEPPLCMFHSLAKRPYANWPVLTSSVQLVFIIIMCTSI